MTNYLEEAAQEIYDNVLTDWQHDRIDTDYELDALILDYAEDMAYDIYATDPHADEDHKEDYITGTEDALYELVIELTSVCPRLSTLPKEIDNIDYGFLDDKI